MSATSRFSFHFHKALCGLAAIVVIAWSCTAAAETIVVNFNDRALDVDTFYNGGPVTNSDGWTSQGVFFGNSYSSDFGGFWNGFAYSNVDDTTTVGFTNQYAAFTGTAHSDSIYAVAFSGPQAFINLPAGYTPESVRVTNTTYAALDMANGSGFSKQFGYSDELGNPVLDGTFPDWFMVTFTGYASAGGTGTMTGSIDFYLADYRFEANADDYIVDMWTFLDLSPLGNAASVRLTWASSDVGTFGINTPVYAAIDSLTIAPVPEPGTWALVAGAVIAALGLRRRSARRS